MKCFSCGKRVKPGKFCSLCGTLAPVEKPAEPIASSAPASSGEGITLKHISPWAIILPLVVLIASFFITLALLLDPDDFSNTGQSKRSKSNVLLAKCANLLYLIDGDRTEVLSRKAADMYLFSSNEQIADGTFFVVENLHEAGGAYADLRGEDEDDSYVVGDLIMISPDGRRTKIDENVYEVVFSLFDEVCYYQVIEPYRQKICVVKEGVSYDVTGWVYGNVYYYSGTADGERAYFEALKDTGESTLCVGADGDYEVVDGGKNALYWLVSNDETNTYVVEDTAKGYVLTAYKDGKLGESLPLAVDYDYNYQNGTVGIQTEDGALEIYRNADTRIYRKEGITSHDAIAFVNTHGYYSDYFLCSFDGNVWIFDTATNQMAPKEIGTISDWLYAYDAVSETVYLFGDSETIYSYAFGEGIVHKVPLKERSADGFYVTGEANQFYYITGDSQYDNEQDTTDLYYYNGSAHILLMANAESYAGNVLTCFDGKKIIWQANENLYMANSDGSGQQELLYDVWWAEVVNGNVYGITNAGDIYLIGPSGDSDLLVKDADDFLAYQPEW